MFYPTLGVRRQLGVVIVCSLAFFITGCFLGWASPSLKKLRAADSLVHLTSYEEVWVVNTMYFGSIFSPFPSGIIMNHLGRKISTLILALFPVLAWVLLYFSTTVYMMMLARFFSGIWVGATQTIIPIYIAEISEPQVRGVFEAISVLSGTFGVNFAFIVGPCVSPHLMAIICGLIPVVFLILFPLCPKSPYYLVMKKRYQAAAESLTWLRGGRPVQAELEMIQDSIQKEVENDLGCMQKIKELVTVPANRKAFIIVEVISSLDKMVGTSFINNFSSVLFPARLGPLTSDHCTMIYGFISTISIIVCAGLIDKIGRKPLLYISSIGIAIPMLWTGIWYFFDTQTSIDVTYLTWMPFAGLFIFGFSNCVGLVPIAIIYQAEMFSSHLKGQGSALTTMNASFWAIVSVSVYATLGERVGMYINFLIFSALGLITMFFTYFVVIETKGKSLQKIQSELRGKNNGKMGEKNIEPYH